MGLWEKAAGAVKDHHSLLQAALSAPNPDIEKAVILCTSHGADLAFDRRSLHRLRHWLRLCPYNLSPLLDALSRRLSRTRSWTVAIKGLYLVHTLLNSRLPCVAALGRLPFDLSNFNAGCGPRSWPFAQFIRSYYAYLDQKSVILFLGGGAADEERNSFLSRELAVLQNLQKLIDLLLQIRPKSRAVLVPLILDVMDWVVIEINDLYGMICRGIAIVLTHIYAGGKAEAIEALNVVKRANRQGEEISEYFKICRDLGIARSARIQAIHPISEEGISELEEIVNGFSDDNEESKGFGDCESEEGELDTVVTEKWENFDEEETVKKSDEEIPDLISL